MDNHKILIRRYKNKEGLERKRFKRNCADESNIKNLMDYAENYFEGHWRRSLNNKKYKESFNRFKNELVKYQEHLFNVVTFEDILNILYQISKSIDGKGLGATFHYDFAVAVAYHNNVKINRVYLNNPTTKNAMKNFLKEDYNKNRQRYKGHDCFNKEDLPKDFLELEADEIEDIICIYSSLFTDFNWKKIIGN